MARCEECIHEKVCVIKAFPDAFENTEWEIKPCNHFKYNNELAPKVLNEFKRFYEKNTEGGGVAYGGPREGGKKFAENRALLYKLKHEVHEKAVRPHNAGIDAYIGLKVFDAILQGYLNKLG